MSLLLDALKRAALEKKQRDYFSTDVSLNESANTAKIEQETAVTDSIIQDYIDDNEAYSSDAAPVKNNSTNIQSIDEGTDELSFNLSEVEFLDDTNNENDNKPPSLSESLTIDTSDEIKVSTDESTLKDTHLPETENTKNNEIQENNNFDQQQPTNNTFILEESVSEEKEEVKKSEIFTPELETKETPKQEKNNFIENSNTSSPIEKPQETIEARAPQPTEITTPPQEENSQTDETKEPQQEEVSQTDEENSKQQQAISALLAVRKKEAKKQRLSYYGIYALLCLVSVAVLASYYIQTSAPSAHVDQSINELLVEQPMSQEMSNLMVENYNTQEESANNTTTNEGNLVTGTEKISDTDIGTLTPIDTIEKPIPVKAQAKNVDQQKAPTIEASSLSPIINEKDLAAIKAYKPIDKNETTSKAKRIQKPKAETKKTIKTNNVVRKIYSTTGTNPTSPMFALNQEAYKYYQRGEHQKARSLYEKILAQEPKNRDALLGAAAIATKQLRPRDALYYYQAQLNQDPQDHYAQAGLLTLQSESSTDPKWISQIDNLLKKYPDASHLHFLKANTHALNGSWQAAQESYFSAWNLQQQNPDYSYNLAIALDQLNQPKEALRFYIQARTLTNTHSHNIKLYQLEKRISQLQIGTNNG